MKDTVNFLYNKNGINEKEIKKEQMKTPIWNIEQCRK